MDPKNSASTHCSFSHVMEELVKFTLLTRGVSPYLTDRYSERVETAEELSKRVNLIEAVDVKSKECGCAPTCCAPAQT